MQALVEECEWLGISMGTSSKVVWWTRIPHVDAVRQRAPQLRVIFQLPIEKHEARRNHGVLARTHVSMLVKGKREPKLGLSHIATCSVSSKLALRNCASL